MQGWTLSGCCGAHEHHGGTRTGMELPVTASFDYPSAAGLAGSVTLQLPQSAVDEQHADRWVQQCALMDQIKEPVWFWS
jgi:hypothetical protein